MIPLCRHTPPQRPFLCRTTRHTVQASQSSSLFLFAGFVCDIVPHRHCTPVIACLQVASSTAPSKLVQRSLPAQHALLPHGAEHTTHNGLHSRAPRQLLRVHKARVSAHTCRQRSQSHTSVIVADDKGGGGSTHTHDSVCVQHARACAQHRTHGKRASGGATPPPILKAKMQYLGNNPRSTRRWRQQPVPALTPTTTTHTHTTPGRQAGAAVVDSQTQAHTVPNDCLVAPAATLNPTQHPNKQHSQRCCLVNSQETRPGLLLCLTRAVCQATTGKRSVPSAGVQA